MSRRLNCVWALTALFSTTCTDVPRPVEQPNIIVIVADDHGYPYSGFMGSDIARTPHLDALAREGMVFTHGFTTASVCRPSMFSLLTGLHPEQWKAEGERSGRDREEPPPYKTILTLPRLLSQAGYRTFQGGKYWGRSYAEGGFTHGTKRDLEPDSRRSRVIRGQFDEREVLHQCFRPTLLRFVNLSQVVSDARGLGCKIPGDGQRTLSMLQVAFEQVDLP